MSRTVKMRGYVLGGVILGGLVGGVIGLIVGLHTYARTAWFAVVELGVPGALLGGLLGVLVGLTFTSLAVAHRETAQTPPV